MTLEAGTKLGRYEIRSKIGEGGMGEVYLAQDTELDRTAAIKILPEALAANQQRLQRFIQEAKAASALNHPNILTIYEIGASENSRFIATEFIDGQTLRWSIREGMKLVDALDVAIHAGGALAAAHAAGIIHRDIKPENIMVRRDGIVKVLDFGLAKLTSENSAEVDSQIDTRFKTDPGAVLGTTSYMSPEQARGRECDQRTDVFSLGVVIYEMVTGCLPFAGATSGEVMAALLDDKEPEPLARYSREVPAELERIVSKALRKNRDHRYQTIKDLVLDLQHLNDELAFKRKLARSGSSKDEANADQGARAVRVFHDDPMALSSLGHVYATMGKRREAEDIVAKLQAVSGQRFFSAYWIAVVYAGLGDNDKAFQYFEKAFDERYFLMIWINSDPRLDNIRSDPRFADLVHRIGLTP